VTAETCRGKVDRTSLEPGLDVSPGVFIKSQHLVSPDQNIPATDGTHRAWCRMEESEICEMICTITEDTKLAQLER
ncbi:uncharacterized, partial [Tachysurus ichikawai]